MSQAISDLQVLLRSMEPMLNAGAFAYVSVPHDCDFTSIPHIVMVREVEGITLVIAEEVALQHKLPVLFRCAWITLHVHSDLQAVGLTAAFAQALAQARISCNVVAGVFHDHIFVPLEKAQPAMDALRQLHRAS